ncbi:hypothetical protein QWY93_15085 [Echinicola jeungdonensis]|uniref:IrrE N-terminal-like domain-containing protein n=1 Tax=Echinicola jeungdonensis TaxID=709343 RepID=A0ABV5J496_9BACT|nr:hypothetical protein [Echinicola jeungdonensis]MDN3670646.1 hypothetical protein [Echinicola jeungdonensis]
MSNSLYTINILSFLNQIDIKVIETALKEDTFLPGIKIDKGRLLYDPDKLEHPGDLLHEAGHMALMTPKEAVLIEGNVADFRPPGQDDEIGVQAWTFAAVLHLDLPPEVVFHDAGYHGESQWLMELFQSGKYPGLSLLAWMGLCEESKFPKMKRWVRE